jgi:large subunit ribosomal protein L5
MAATLQKFYVDKVRPQLKEHFSIKNINAVPKLEAIVLNATSKDTLTSTKIVEGMADELTRIAGQKAVVTKAKKSIATFKLREGQGIGCRVTLRGDNMYHFFSRLVNVALPRVRDFQGVKTKSFDGRGNYTMGIKEQIIFPEIEFDKVDRIRGLSIAIKTTAPNDEQSLQLLKLMGMPFKS